MPQDAIADSGHQRAHHGVAGESAQDGGYRLLDESIGQAVRGPMDRQLLGQAVPLNDEHRAHQSQERERSELTDPSPRPVDSARRQFDVARRVG